MWAIVFCLYLHARADSYSWHHLASVNAVGMGRAYGRTLKIIEKDHEKYNGRLCHTIDAAIGAACTKAQGTAVRHPAPRRRCGITPVIQAGWNPFAPWLLATYGLLVLMGLVGKYGTDGWKRQLQSSLQSSRGGAALNNVRGLVTDRRALLARLTIIAIFLVIMALMDQKPSFGW